MSTVHGMVVDNKTPVYNYNWLCQKMQNRERVCIRYNLGQIYGIINGIRPEDGSGRHWLVTIYDNGNSSEIYVRAE
jgi:hypothetical protein